jgi:hypothetical protein
LALVRFVRQLCLDTGPIEVVAHTRKDCPPVVGQLAADSRDNSKLSAEVLNTR